jgi:oxygen-independent coproporphyrinogen-3 oxidase
VEAGKFRDFRAAGVNRLSLGIQSFDPRHLQALGRIHDGEEARKAVAIAQDNFDNVNFDLMYGLPGQSPEEALADVEAALGYGPAHLSCYHLTIEPNTRFHRFPPQLPDDDATSAMQDAIEARLAEAGYEHYEVSAYAKRGARCAHNMNYWLFGDYIGIGAGAHGKLSFPDRIEREVRVKHPAAYMDAAEAGAPVQERHRVEADAVGFEFMMNALRLNGGFALRLFEERAGVPLTAVLPGLEEAERRGLIERDHERVVPTALGQRFLNDLLQIFLGPDAPRPAPQRDGAFA